MLRSRSLGFNMHSFEYNIIYIYDLNYHHFIRSCAGPPELQAVLGPDYRAGEAPSRLIGGKVPFFYCVSGVGYIEAVGTTERWSAVVSRCA